MNKVILKTILALLISLVSAPIAAIASPHAIREAATLSKIESLKIINSDGQFSNLLTARHKAVKKGLSLEYRWLLDGKPIWTANTSKYEKSPDDCGHKIQVKVTLKSSKRILDTKTSSAYDPAVCTFATRTVDAGYSIYSCGMEWPDGQCNQWQGKGFFGWVSGSAHPTSWFRVKITEIQPSQVIGWRAAVTGYFEGYALNNAMITRSKPEWACCDFNGVKFPSGDEVAWVSDSWPEISSDGFAYVGFSYFDKFHLSESLIVNTIQIELEYTPGLD